MIHSRYGHGHGHGHSRYEYERGLSSLHAKYENYNHKIVQI